MPNVTDAPRLVSLDEDFYYQDPQGFFARLRESRPVAPVRMPGYGRAWVVTRYEDVRAVLTDPRMARTSTGGRAAAGPGRARRRSSTRTCSTRTRLSTPGCGRVQKPSHRAGPRCDRGLMRSPPACWTRWQARGDDVIDLLGQYARPLPITVICELLGVPVAAREWVRVTVYAYDERTEHAWVERELAAYFSGLITARRAKPGDDLVSDLVIASDNAHADGAADGLTGSELVATVFLLIMAGFDTTVNLIASATLALLTHPEQMARLRQDPSLLPAAVEELLRFTNPVNHANDRFTTEDVLIGDVVVPAGEWVIPAIASADWDPARFPDPDRLNLDRNTSGHLAFGHGIHHCLGAPLARMEAEVALGALLARFPRITLAIPASELRWRPVSLMNGLESLPIRLG